MCSEEGEWGLASLRRWRRWRRRLKSDLFKEWPIPCLFFVYFRLLKQFLQQMYVKNVHLVYSAGIRTHKLQIASLIPLPLGHGYSPNDFSVPYFVLSRSETNCSFQATKALSFFASVLLYNWWCFFNKGQTRSLFLFSSFSKCSGSLGLNFDCIHWKSIDVVPEIWTQGGRMVGPDGTTELWRANVTISVV